MTEYISIKRILDDLLSHPMLADLTYESAINYTEEFIRLVGVPQSFEDKVEELEVKDYRAMLPCDFVEIIQARSKEGIAYRETTDSFHFRPSKDEREFTYKLQNRYIYTSVKEDTLTLAYKVMPLDCEGVPMVPDNSSFKVALELYIKLKMFTIMFDMGKISQQVLMNTQKEYAWYVGQAQTSMIRPSIDQMESITNMLNTLVTNVSSHSEGFRHLGSKEYLKRH